MPQTLKAYLKAGPLLLLTLSGITACTEANAVADAIARDQAKMAVNEVVAKRFPGVNVAPVSDCVIDNASAGEILAIAANTAAGAQSDNVVLVQRIAARPETTQCLTRNALPLVAELLR